MVTPDVWELGQTFPQTSGRPGNHAEQVILWSTF